MRHAYKIFIILLIVSLSVTGATRAQSTADLIEQLNLDYQKLAELKNILRDMYMAYHVLDQGYTDIRNTVEGNFHLHQLFLDGLWAVSPVVRNYHRVTAILSAEYNIVSEYKLATANAHGSGVFSLQELSYIDKVYATLFNRSIRCLDELSMVLTADQLRMSDAQRLQAIDRVYFDISGQLGFLRHFNADNTIQLQQRQQQSNDIHTIKQLYGNPD